MNLSNEIAKISSTAQLNYGKRRLATRALCDHSKITIQLQQKERKYINKVKRYDVGVRAQTLHQRHLFQKLTFDAFGALDWWHFHGHFQRCANVLCKY